MSIRRYRSAAACQNCRKRKVRCSVTVTGIPCIGCTQDARECTVPLTKSQTIRERRTRRTASVISSPPHANSNGLIPQSSLPLDASPNAPPSHNIDRSELAGMRGVSNPPGYSRRQDEERTGVEIATQALGKNKKAGQAPFYTGDSPGFGAVFDICSPPDQPTPRHILLTSKTSVSLSPEDKAYLCYKGVFNMPQKETCDELLRAYFHHVHPIMPVIDVTTLPHLYPSGDGQPYNLILLWSIFLLPQIISRLILANQRAFRPKKR